MTAYRAILLSSLLLASPSLWAADTTPSAPPPPDELRQARALIEKKDWRGAAETLATFTRVNPSSADGFNLLGYSYRHLQRYDEALAAYGKALSLDPNHRGAHEYIGIAYLQLGQLGKAKEHLDALDRICTFSCEEYRDLKRAYEEALRASQR